MFCSSSGSISRLLPWTLQQLISEKGGKPEPCVNPAHDQIMSQTTYTYDIGVFHSYQPVSNTPTIAAFPDQIEPLCVPSHHTKPTGRSHIPKQAKFLTLRLITHTIHATIRLPHTPRYMMNPIEKFYLTVR